MRIRIPDETTAIVGLTYVLLMSGVRDHDEDNFEGAMIWFRRWELWSESIDRVGQFLLESVNMEPDRDALLAEKPAMLLTEHELVRGHATLSLPMMFQWDAVYCPASGYLLATISHHGDLDVIMAPQVFERERARFSEWNPIEA